MFRFPWSGRSPKTPSFTNEQIQAKVYELWKARGYVGSSPDEDRLKAIALLEEAGSKSGKKHRLDDWGNKDDREFALKVRQFHWERLKTIISALGLGATAIAAIGLFITYRQGEERLVTERFAKAVEQLGSKEITVRIGGVYALERVAKDSPKDHWTVMEVLTAFVRERSPNRQPDPGTAKRQAPNGKDPELPGIPTDVQSALTAIGRRDASKDVEGQRLDLSQTYLVRANLDRANLQAANLRSTDLQWASLGGTNLRKANLRSTDLRWANLHSANLQAANLWGANFLRANLDSADLQGADLLDAKLSGAGLDSTNLQQARLGRSQLQKANLRSANLQGADLWDANLLRADLHSANLQGAILLVTDLRGTEGLTQPQLEGGEPLLLCHVALSKAIKVNPNRDCHRLPQELVKRYPDLFPTLKDAKNRVDDARRWQWK